MCSAWLASVQVCCSTQCRKQHVDAVGVGQVESHPKLQKLLPDAVYRA